ncbi:U4/U6 small nuclear ribonucleoprotein Prp31 [Achlya hypogyna]|uniref:U4/U6 small nuclear ribonucleoprotein Prp31 n=1 Tax=Achlya hypogyna TaxID=1202772 RepID=A0A1V9YJA2_ACHHY|nr:U4/U6 small nuclear ribonucleoprotein Prp31 [Achlya hypogyna]
MSSLADSFLEDLDELSGSSGSESEHHEDDNMSDEGDEEADAAAAMKKEADVDAILRAAANSGRGLAAVAQLRKKASYGEHIASVEAYLAAGTSQATHALDGEEYKLIVASNDLMVRIDDEIILVHRFLIELYTKKFPGLETLVPAPVDYARVAQRIGNETDMTRVDITDLVPSATVMSVQLTGSSGKGSQLSSDDLKQLHETCEEIITLDGDKGRILQFVESRMHFLAPNLSALIGTRITAQLIGVAGGVDELSRIPSCNIQVLGQQKRVLAGFSSMSTLRHTGILFGCELIQSLPPDLRKKANRVVAGKVALAARVDSQPHRTASCGQQFYVDLLDKFEKWQAPNKAKTKKALPRPDEKPRRKRGGKRYRKMKERVQMTEVRREVNRQNFGTAHDEYGDNAMGISSGRLGADGSGTLRVIKKAQKQTKLKLKAATFTNRHQSGLASSLAFTPVQGIELMNPSAAADRVREANKKYFGATSGFTSTIQPQPQP